MFRNNKLFTGCCFAVALAGLASAGLAVASDIADAAENGDLSLVRTLLEAKVDVNEPQVDGATALLWASHTNDLAMAEVLINGGADVSARNQPDA